MTTVTPTYNSARGGNGSVKEWVFAITTANLNGSPIEFPDWYDRVWVATGTFGSATLAIQGSADGTNWVTLNDVNGNAATLTADGHRHVQATPRFMRPFLTVAGSGAAITVTCLARRPTDIRV